MSSEALTERVLHQEALSVAGSRAFSLVRSREVTLIVNVTGAPTGTDPTLLFSLQQTDPSDNSAGIEAPYTMAPITGPGVFMLHAGGLISPSLVVSWSLTGAGAAFPMVSATLVDKEQTSRSNPFASLVKFEAYPTEELRADDISKGDRFHGRALSGTATSSSRWELVRFIRNANGDVLRLIYRTGTSWDDRLTIS